MEPLPTEPAPTPVDSAIDLSLSASPTEPTESAPTPVSDEPLVSYFKRGAGTQGWDLTPITYYNMHYNDSQTGPMPLAPPGEIPDDLKMHDWGPNPWPEYADAEGFKEEATQPFKRGPDGITPVWSWEIGDVENNSSTPIPISDSTTTPLPYVPPPFSEDYLPPEHDYSGYPPLDSYDYSGLESYFDSLPAGAHTYEDVLSNYIGRPVSPEESSMLSDMYFPEHSKLGEIRNLFDLKSAEDYYSPMPTEDPFDPSFNPPPNNDGLLGIVGGGIIDPGPVYTNN